MAKNKNTFGKLLAFTTTLAAIGGTCYIFRDKIKQSSIYKFSADKLSNIYNKFSEKMCDQPEDNFFFDDEDFEEQNLQETSNEREYTSITINTKDEDSKEEPEKFSATADNDSEDEEPSRFTAAVSSSEDNTAESLTAEDDNSGNKMSDISIDQTTTESVSNDAIKEDKTEDSIPTIAFGYQNHSDSDTESVFSVSESDNEEVDGYENEGLSDVSEDPDVLEEQDKLDF